MPSLRTPCKHAEFVLQEGKIVQGHPRHVLHSAGFHGDVSHARPASWFANGLDVKAAGGAPRLRYDAHGSSLLLLKQTLPSRKRH